LREGAPFQQTQFRIGDERVESVRMPLTIETNFYLKSLGLIRPGSTLESVGWQLSQALDLRRRRAWHDGKPGKADKILFLVCATVFS